MQSHWDFLTEKCYFWFNAFFVAILKSLIILNKRSNIFILHWAWQNMQRVLVDKRASWVHIHICACVCTCTCTRESAYVYMWKKTMLKIMTNQILINKTNNPAVENNLKIIHFVKDMVKLLKLKLFQKKKNDNKFQRRVKYENFSITSFN